MSTQLNPDHNADTDGQVDNATQSTRTTNRGFFLWFLSHYYMHKLIKLILIKNAVTKREINKFAFNFSKKLIQPAYYRLGTYKGVLINETHT